MEPNGLTEARLALTAAALAGDSGSLYHLVAKLLDDGVPFDTVLFDLLSPIGRDIGLRWQQGDYLVSEEHAATSTVEIVVSLLAGSFDQPESGVTVVVAASEGDLHSLPPRMVAANLLFLGYRTTFLGANVLASDLEEYLHDGPPDALALSCSMTTHLLGARAVIHAAHAAGVPVVAGGRGFGDTPARATSLGADAWVADPREIPTTIDTWRPDPVAAEAGARDPSHELVALLEQRPAVLGAADAKLRELLPGGRNPRLVDELSLLLAATEAALLVGDDDVLGDMVSWQRDTLASHGYTAADAVVTALRDAVSVVSPEAASRLAAAAS